MATDMLYVKYIVKYYSKQYIHIHTGKSGLIITVKIKLTQQTLCPYIGKKTSLIITVKTFVHTHGDPT